MKPGKKLANTPIIRRLPIMQSFEDAKAVAQQEDDPFYLVAFLIQRWLTGLVQRAATEYAEKKDPRERSLQNGEAWRALLEAFPSVNHTGFGDLFSSLIRFCASDDSPRNSLRRALVPLSIEHRRNPSLFRRQSLNPEGRAPASPHSSSPGPSDGTGNAEGANSNDHARLTLVRWCDWLDAAIHLRTHRHWHAAPACFDPDPETRALAALGDAERHLADLDPHAQMCWLRDFSAAAAQFKHSPKWATVGKAMSDDSDRLWPYADVDTLVIALWPLVKQYNWTYRDLLNVIQPALKRPNAYPCNREQSFATYCANVLGLRKTGRGLSAKNGKPTGYEIAIEFCPPLSAGGPSSTRP